MEKKTNQASGKLLLFSGLPGSGKTTLARKYAENHAVLHLNSDILRKELGLLGKYTNEDKEKVYATLLDRTRAALLAGEEVVVDSTFYKESIREPFRSLAKECGAKTYWVEVTADEHTIRERLKTPRLDSEADFAVYEKIRDAAEPFTEPHLTVRSDMGLSLEEMAEQVREYILVR